MHFVKEAPGFCRPGRVTPFSHLYPHLASDIHPAFLCLSHFPASSPGLIYQPDSFLWPWLACMGLTFWCLCAHLSVLVSLLLIMITNWLFHHSSMTHLDSKEGALERHNSTAPLPLGSPCQYHPLSLLHMQLTPLGSKVRRSRFPPFLQLFLAQGLSLPLSNCKAGKISMKDQMQKGQLDDSFETLNIPRDPALLWKQIYRTIIQSEVIEILDLCQFRGLALLLIHFSR